MVGLNSVSLPCISKLQRRKRVVIYMSNHLLPLWVEWPGRDLRGVSKSEKCDSIVLLAIDFILLFYNYKHPI